MHPQGLEEIEKEIERLRRRYATLAHERAGMREVTARWVAETAALAWFVPLDDVVEADIDVEITSEVLIVRAERQAPEPALLVGILPVPAGFDPEGTSIRFTEATLVVRIRRAGGGSA